MTRLQIQQAVTVVFAQRASWLIFAVTTSLFFTLYILVPVLTIAGNSVPFQLTLFRARDYILMVVLALLMGLTVALQVYNWRKQREAAQSLAHGGAAGAASVFAAVVGSATCASCLASLFLLLGLGTGSVFFVLQHQVYFLFAAIALILVSLYYSVRKTNAVCSC